MELSRFNVQNTLTGLLSDLPERSRDVIVSRFGIGRDDYETLESIGQRYGITRERVRQIEADALKNIQSRKEKVVPILTLLEEFVRSRGGVLDEESLTREFAERHLSGIENPERYRGLVSLVLAISDRFSKSPATDSFSTRWYLDETALRRQESVAQGIVTELKKRKEVADADALVAMARSHEPSLNREEVLTYLASSRELSQNVFGQWGLADWGEIRPRGVKDKAYLVMKQEGRPLHFREVAELINRHGFSARPALAQTVHNELIKDGRFVLVGRGLYALREWGYKEGTVRDVIERVLAKSGPLKRDEIIKAVLTERFVKPSTIILNLNTFQKTNDGKYTLA